MSTLTIPHGLTLETMVSTWPDEPLENIERFDNFVSASEARIRQAQDWIEPQQVCTVIMKHHGTKGLQRVLHGIAKACSANEIPMRPRVRAVAELHGMKVY